MRLHAAGGRAHRYGAVEVAYTERQRHHAVVARLRRVVDAGGRLCAIVLVDIWRLVFCCAILQSVMQDEALYARNPMRVISLFSGYGGLDLAFKRCGEEF